MIRLMGNHGGIKAHGTLVYMGVRGVLHWASGVRRFGGGGVLYGEARGSLARMPSPLLEEFLRRTRPATRAYLCDASWSAFLTPLLFLAG